MKKDWNMIQAALQRDAEAQNLVHCREVPRRPGLAAFRLIGCDGELRQVPAIQIDEWFVHRAGGAVQSMAISHLSGLLLSFTPDDGTAMLLTAAKALHIAKQLASFPPCPVAPSTLRALATTIPPHQRNAFIDWLALARATMWGFAADD